MIPRFKHCYMSRRVLDWCLLFRNTQLLVACASSSDSSSNVSPTSPLQSTRTFCWAYQSPELGCGRVSCHPIGLLCMFFPRMFYNFANYSLRGTYIRASRDLTKPAIRYAPTKGNFLASYLPPSQSSELFRRKHLRFSQLQIRIRRI